MLSADMHPQQRAYISCADFYAHQAEEADATAIRLRRQAKEADRWPKEVQWLRWRADQMAAFSRTCRTTATKWRKNAQQFLDPNRKEGDPPKWDKD